MKYFFLVGIIYLFSFNVFPGGEISLFSDADSNSDKGPTVITCDGPLEVDYSVNVADLTDNVLVRDPQMDMRADHMKVYFSDETKEIEKVIADGRVRFKKDEKQAKSQNAVYTQSDGSIVLTGNPKVKRGIDILSGEKITFFRNDERMLCEPSAKLIFYDVNDSTQTDKDWFWSLDENESIGADSTQNLNDLTVTNNKTEIENKENSNELENNENNEIQNHKNLMDTSDNKNGNEML